MSDVQLYLFEADKDRAEATRLAGVTAKKLESKQLKLIDLVQSLGEYLNNDDPSLRTKTIAFLAQVLEALPTKVLTTQQRDLLADFILSRVEDGTNGLVYCARGLSALERLGTFSKGRVASIMESLFQNTSPLVQCKSQNERQTVLLLLDTLMAKYRPILQKIHEAEHDFMSRLIAYFDGEKDPRNLMIVFSILQAAAVEWDVSAEASNLFEAVFNYFPITFRPPPGDPYGITAQDLKNRLCDCIASTGYLAPYSIPALLDKLDSTSMNTKRDTIQTLTACINHYGPETVHLYSITLWDALKFEILNVQEEDLAEEALKALESIATQLSSSTHLGPLQNYLNPVIKECNEHLEDTPTKQSVAASRMLSAISEASLEASDMLGKGCLPQLFVLMKTADNLPRRRGFMEILNQLLQANLSTYGPWRKPNFTGDTIPQKPLRPSENPFSDFRTESTDAFTSALTRSPKSEVSFRILALDGLRSMVMIRGLLEDLEVAKIIRTIDEVVIHEEQYGKDEVKAAAMEALVQIALQKPQLVIDSSIPEFMAQLPDTDVDHDVTFVSILEALAKLSAEQQIFKTIMIRLKNKLYTAIRQGASAKYILAILSSMLYAFSSGAAGLSDPAVFGGYYQDIVMPLLKDLTIPTEQFANAAALRNDDVLDTIGRICNVIVRSQQWVSQTEICRNVYTLFRQAELPQVPPFTTQDPSTMLVSTHLLASLQKQATPHTDVPELLTTLIHFARTSSPTPAVLSATITQISLLANKHLKPASTAVLISPLLSDSGPSSLLSPDTLTPTTLRIVFALLRALILRTDPQLTHLLPTFLTLLTHPIYGAPAARAWSTLLVPDIFLTKENHCVIYALHRHRLLTLSLPFLSATFRATETTADGKTNVLVALSGLLYYIPYDLIRVELGTLVPLLLQSLVVEDADVKARTIAVVEKIVLEDTKVVEEHASSLVSRLLNVAVATPATLTGATKAGASTTGTTTTAPPKARAAALACLTACVGACRTEVLLPMKAQVGRRLMGALDDPRRAVRAEAVRARRAWGALGGSAAEDD